MEKALEDKISRYITYVINIKSGQLALVVMCLFCKKAIPNPCIWFKILNLEVVLDWVSIIDFVSTMSKIRFSRWNFLDKFLFFNPW